jgi:hypothetical protein
VMANSAQKVALTCIGKLNHAIPVSNGIIEHREKIGSAVWLFLLLIDWTTSEDENGIGKVLGGKPIKLKDLTEALHLKERQVSSQLQRLRSGGYIRLRRTPYGYSIEVLKSKKFINRDRQRSAEHDGSDQQQVTNPDQHKIADHEVETSNKLQQRSAIICRNKEDLTVDYKKQREESKKPILPRSKVSDPRIKELTESWAALYLTRCGEGYPFTKKDFGQFENALRQFDVPRLKELAAQFFATADPWIKEKAGFTVGVFVSRLASLASISAAKLNGHKPAELKEMTL